MSGIFKVKCKYCKSTLEINVCNDSKVKDDNLIPCAKCSKNSILIRKSKKLISLKVLS